MFLQVLTIFPRLFPHVGFHSGSTIFVLFVYVLWWCLWIWYETGRPTVQPADLHLYTSSQVLSVSEGLDSERIVIHRLWHITFTELCLTYTLTQSATARPACRLLAAVSDFTFVFLPSPFFSRITVRSPLVKWSSCCLLLWCTGQPPMVDVAVTTPFQVGYSWQLIGQTWVGSKLIATALVWINLIAIVGFC